MSVLGWPAVVAGVFWVLLIVFAVAVGKAAARGDEHMSSDGGEDDLLRWLP